MTWRAIIFDLDDTLYPEREYVFSGFRAVARWAAANLRVSERETFAELAELFESGVRGETFNRWVACRELPNDAVPDLIRAYRDHVPTIAAFQPVPALVASLSAVLPLGLVSDGPAAVQRRKWDALGLGRYFSAEVFTDELGRSAWKPSPVGFQIVAKQLGVHPVDAVYVGDNPLKDFRGAREAGMTTLWLRAGHGLYALAEPPQIDDRADFVASGWHDLSRLLGCHIKARVRQSNRPNADLA